MKAFKYVLLMAMALPLTLSGQDSEKLNYFPLLGEDAPKFKAESTNGNITFPNDFKKSWKILFSHPQDFTPVCTSEILELAHLNKKFEKMNVKLAILSTDNLERHKLWVESMQQLTYKDKSNASISFPLIADPYMKASKMYGMVHPNQNTTRNVRGVFIIDPDNKIRSITFYPHEVGRNIAEIERTVLALQKSDSEQVFTPANWNPGEDLIVPFQTYSPDMDMNKAKEKDADIYPVSWYLLMRKDRSGIN